LSYCGKSINWETSIEKQNHIEWMQISKEKYNELKKKMNKYGYEIFN